VASPQHTSRCITLRGSRPPPSSMQSSLRGCASLQHGAAVLSILDTNPQQVSHNRLSDAYGSFVGKIGLFAGRRRLSTGPVPSSSYFTSGLLATRLDGLSFCPVDVAIAQQLTRQSLLFGAGTLASRWLALTPSDLRSLVLPPAPRRATQLVAATAAKRAAEQSKRLRRRQQQQQRGGRAGAAVPPSPPSQRAATACCVSLPLVVHAACSTLLALALDYAAYSVLAAETGGVVHEGAHLVRH
jgi:hypothetical protein